MIHDGEEVPCDQRIFLTDTRQDNTWFPPKIEQRKRCVKCGWQGKWKPIEDYREVN
jgi:hypothetical protein